jgi:hypothetical protein
MMFGEIIIIMDDDYPEDAEKAWDHLVTRLETLRVIGGVPAMRFELVKFDNETLAYINDVAVKVILTAGVNSEEQTAAFEIAASINDVIEHRKGE